VSKFYMANENARALVDEFISGLATLAGTCNAGVLLLGHDAKLSANGGGEYSGSTAWNNSSRARWALTFNRDTQVRELMVKKNNYGTDDHGGEWVWSSEHGVLDMQGALASSGVNPATREVHLEEVARIVVEMYDRKEWTSAGAKGPLGPIENNPEISELGLNTGTLRTYLRQLAADGVLEIETVKDTHNGGNRQRYRPVL